MNVLCLNGSERVLPAPTYKYHDGGTSPLPFTATLPPAGSWFTYNGRLFYRLKNGVEIQQVVQAWNMLPRIFYACYNSKYTPINIWTGEPL